MGEANDWLKGISRSITIEHAVEVLNEALNLDQEAVQNLVMSRHPCNAALAAHPTIQVSDAPAVGMLGLMNGLFGINRYGCGGIIVEIDDDTGRVIRFRVTSPDGGERHGR